MIVEKADAAATAAQSRVKSPTVEEQNQVQLEEVKKDEQDPLDQAPSEKLGAA